MNLTY
jgi:hypothetical protein